MREPREPVHFWGSRKTGWKKEGGGARWGEEVGEDLGVKEAGCRTSGGGFKWEETGRYGNLNGPFSFFC